MASRRLSDYAASAGTPMSASQHDQHHQLLSSSTPRSSHSSGSSIKQQQHRTHNKRRLKAHTSYLVLGGVLAWLLLRYVVDVRLSVKWRVSPLQAAAAARAQEGRRHCSNTCFKARDGVCDEGRPPIAAPVPAIRGQQQSVEQAAQWRVWEQRRHERQHALVVPVSCDLGTDCDDCGPWVGHQAHPDWSEPQLPIAFLRGRNISVRARSLDPRAAAPLTGLRFAYVDPNLDVDVSRHMEASGVVEIGISQVFHTVLAGQCGSSSGSSSRDSSSPVVADVGANFGFFSMLAAHLGCRVVAWEPVPAFRALLAFNLAANRLASRVSIRPTVVAHPPGSKQVVVVPNRGIWGTAGINGDNLDAGIGNDGEYERVEVVSDSLDEVLAGQHVLLLKVDVEGHEPSVLATAQQLLAGGSVDNVVLEYTPGVVERAARWSEMGRPPAMLLNLTAAGFHLSWLPDAFVRVWSEGRSIGAPLPPLRAITSANLQHDLWDARVFRTGVFEPSAATPFCQAMLELGLANPGVPERLHPKSFHSMFGHNTNVWATRNQQLLAEQQLVGVPVGIIPWDTPVNASWFPPEGTDTGLAAVSCSALAAEYAARLAPPAAPPASEVATLMAVLIGRRCRCTHGLPCQRHVEVVERCTRAGKTPYRDD